MRNTVTNIVLFSPIWAFLAGFAYVMPGPFFMLATIFGVAVLWYFTDI